MSRSLEAPVYRALPEPLPDRRGQDDGSHEAHSYPNEERDGLEIGRHRQCAKRL